MVLWSAKKDESQNHSKQVEDAQDVTCKLECQFAMDHEHEESRMKVATSELANLISSLNLGNEEMDIHDYVQLVGEEIIDAKYNMDELLDLAQGRENHFGFKFKRRANGRWCVWLGNTNSQISLSPWLCRITIKSKHPLIFSIIDVMNMQSSMDKLNKMSNSNINKLHQKTINSYSCSV